MSKEIPINELLQNDAIHLIPIKHHIEDITNDCIKKINYSFENTNPKNEKEKWIDLIRKISIFDSILISNSILLVKDKKEIRAASVQMKNINFRASRPFKKEVGDKMRLQRGESITRPKKNSISRETCRERLNTYLENHLFISRTDYSHLTGRNKKVAIEELNSFITDGIIRKEGVGKLTVYIKV